MLSTSSISSSSEADTSKDSDEILDVSTTPQVYTLIALASLAASRESDLDLVPFNTLGLLYNGDTLHPSARAFYTSDTDLTLPDKIIPKIVPSREAFVYSAITDAVSLRVMNQKRKRKAAKVRPMCEQLMKKLYIYNVMQLVLYLIATHLHADIHYVACMHALRP